MHSPLHHPPTPVRDILADLILAVAILVVGMVVGAACGWAYWWFDEMTLRVISLRILFFPGLFFSCLAGLAVRRFAETLGEGRLRLVVMGGVVAGVLVLYFGGHVVPEGATILARSGHEHVHAEAGRAMAIYVTVLDATACFLSAVMASRGRLPGNW